MKPRGGPGSNQHARKPPRPRETAATSLPSGAADTDPLTSPGRTAINTHAQSSPQIERCPADPEYAVDMLFDRISDQNHYVMFAALRGDWAQALTISYDAARQAVSMLLLHEGWRVPDSAKGKHMVIGEAAAAWLATTGASGLRIAKSFQSARKARNNFEYPDSRAPLPDSNALRGMTLDNVRLVDLARQELGLPARPDAIPTDENIDAWRAEHD